MKKLLRLLLLVLCPLVAFADEPLQRDVVNKEGMYTVFIRPYNAKQWDTHKLLPAETTCQVTREAWLDIRDRFSDLKRLMVDVNNRAYLHKLYIEAMGEEESELSMAAVRFEIVIYDDVYLFDRYGRLWIDGRFVTPEENRIVEEIEKIYAKIYANSTLKNIKGSALVNKDEENRTRKVPIFRGFEDDHYQEHDDLIVKLVDEFNANRAKWAGATSEQAAEIPRLKPALVKAHMIEETGGKAHRSLDAWRADPLQVNVPGDWTDYKADLGLNKPSKRNEGDIEKNLRAAIMFLSRKGFGVSGQPASNRPTGVFDDWPRALSRYNGRNDETLDGRRYKDAYAERIIRRAGLPDNFSPISIPVKKK